MWRSLGWLFVNGWSPRDCTQLFYSGLVQVRDTPEFKVRQVWITEDVNLEELRKAAEFVSDARMRGGRKS